MSPPIGRLAMARVEATYWARSDPSVRAFHSGSSVWRTASHALDLLQVGNQILLAAILSLLLEHLAVAHDLTQGSAHLVEEMAHRRAGLAGDPDLSHTRPSICPWAGGLAGERRKFEAPFRVRSVRSGWSVLRQSDSPRHELSIGTRRGVEHVVQYWLRDECLNAEWLANRVEAAALIEDFRRRYNARV